jgi:DNA primase
LKRFTDNITVIYDGDAAGIHASIRGIDMILAEGLNVRIVSLPEPEDPDSYARTHTAEEVRNYIIDNEVDFITFKAHLLQRETQNDPIKRADAINDMVRSISQIPDDIRRAVFVKECAHIMDIDEYTLRKTVADKRLLRTTGGGNDVQTFVNNQRRQEQPPQQQTSTEVKPIATLGNDTLERELLKYLIRYGHYYFDYKDGHETFQMNVADVILTNLDALGLHFQNATYDRILGCYKEHYQQSGEGQEIPTQFFTNNTDADVCSVAIDLLTEDDQYVASKIWTQKDVHIESIEEILSAGVPKAVILYKSDAIKRLIREQNELLTKGGLSEEEETAILGRIANLNSEKVSISHKVQRSIL